MPSAAAVRHYAGTGGLRMTGKFATAGVFAIVFSVVLIGFICQSAHAQSTPSGQTQSGAQASPANGQEPAVPNAAAQQPSSQEESVDEQPLGRRKKPRDYKKWNYDVGAGAHIDGGATKTFVRGGGIEGTIGVARNANKYLGLRGDFMYADLPLRQSSLSIAQATSSNSYLLAFMVNPIINFPVTSNYSGYVLFGPGYLRRSGTLNSDTTVPGSGCNAFWNWWGGTCNNLSLPLNGSFVNTAQNEFGYDVGAGVTRKMPSGVQVFAEFRLIHGSANGTTTDVRPIAIGVRW